MEELDMSRIMKIKVGEKEYKLGYPTRKDQKFRKTWIDLITNGGKLIT